MSIQFPGMIGYRPVPEALVPVGPILDRPYITVFARIHEETDFDQILVDYWSGQPDGFLVATVAGLAISRIGLLLTHRPGLVVSILVAHKLATLERLLGGRLAVHITSGGSDTDRHRDDDYLDHDQRCARSDKFIELLKRTWTSTEPFDSHGACYRVEHAFSVIHPQQKPHIPAYFGGSSEIALKVVGKQADVFMLWGEPLTQAAETISAVREQARSNGREVKFSLSFRPILGRAEGRAWVKAEVMCVSAGVCLGKAGSPKGKPQSIGVQYLLKTVEQGEHPDECLWTRTARLVGGGHNSIAPIGIAEQVADALLVYYDLGMRSIFIHGFDLLADTVEYGRELIPLTRAKVVERERRHATA